MKRGVVKAALILISVVVATGISELFYRFYLATTLSTSIEESIPKRALNYTAQSRAHTRFSQEYGYIYVPNERVMRVKIREGYLVLCHPFRTNAIGNTNNIEGDYADAELKVLVFGDSFTANIHHDGRTWPGLLQKSLALKLAKPVHVMNFGRDAYGVLQMFDLAAGKVRELKPDLVVIAFITNDLHRDRHWHVRKEVAGETRFFISAKPTQRLDPSYSVDATLVHPSISQSWCNSLLSEGRPDDPLLLELNRTFWERKVEHDQRVDIYSLADSFLYNRIVRDDPFFGVERLSRIPRTTLRDFAADPRMVENIDSLNRAGIPYVLLHLPRFRELEAGSHVLDSQQKALRDSLEAVSGKEVISILEDLADSVENREALFLLPHDSHPSLAGIRQYAEAVSTVLIERGLVR